MFSSKDIAKAEGWLLNDTSVGDYSWAWPYNDTFTTNSTAGGHGATTPSSVSMETEDFGLVLSWHEVNVWAFAAAILVFCTAAGNILVCLAISWEKRLQNVTNYFLMSLAITDLMVAILVMPLGILTLVRGKYRLMTLNTPQSNKHYDATFTLFTFLELIFFYQHN